MILKGSSQQRSPSLIVRQPSSSGARTGRGAQNPILIRLVLGEPKLLDGVRAKFAQDARERAAFSIAVPSALLRFAPRRDRASNARARLLLRDALVSQSILSISKLYCFIHLLRHLRSFHRRVSLGVRPRESELGVERAKFVRLRSRSLSLSRSIAPLETTR